MARAIVGWKTLEKRRQDVAVIDSASGPGNETLIRPRLVFLDEAGASTDTVRRIGWVPRGRRVVVRAPHGH